MTGDISEEHMVFKRIRDIALRKPHRSTRYKNWLHSQGDNSNKDLHHLFGSTQSLKSTDLMLIAVTRERHNYLELNPHENHELIPECIHNLLQYVAFLEERVEQMEWERLELMEKKDESGD